jgi:hypothetical protein
MHLVENKDALIIIRRDIVNGIIKSNEYYAVYYVAKKLFFITGSDRNNEIQEKKIK